MKGYSIIIDPVQGVMETSRTDWDKPIPLNVLQSAVGGFIESIPLFECMMYEGQEIETVAFCNEEGKLNNLPRNEVAQGIWTASIASRNNISYEEAEKSTQDVLVGPVIVVWGDEEFMAEL